MLGRTPPWAIDNLKTDELKVALNDPLLHVVPHIHHGCHVDTCIDVGVATESTNLK
jgi:hypothetical protein